jgi:hypothetical protein
MSIPHDPKPAKLFVSVIAGSAAHIAKILSQLVKRYGILDFVSELLAFDYTDYYFAEMGQPLYRRFASFGAHQSSGDRTECRRKPTGKH